MKNSTIRTIYALKKGCKSFDDVVTDYWSEYSGVPAKYYDKRTLMDIAVAILRDYISTADNPSYVLFELFDYMRFDCKHFYNTYENKEFDDRVRYAIWTTLAMTDVVDENGNFVNGFRELND